MAKFAANLTAIMVPHMYSGVKNRKSVYFYQKFPISKFSDMQYLWQVLLHSFICDLSKVKIYKQNTTVIHVHKTTKLLRPTYVTYGCIKNGGV